MDMQTVCTALNSYTAMKTIGKVQRKSSHIVYPIMACKSKNGKPESSITV